MEDEDCLDDEENGGDVDDAVFGIDEVGCLDYLLKQYPYNGSNSGPILPPFSGCNHPNAAFGPIMDSVYANFPDNPNSASSGFGNLPAGDYASTSSEKCFVSLIFTYLFQFVRRYALQLLTVRWTSSFSGEI